MIILIALVCLLSVESFSQLRLNFSAEQIEQMKSEAERKRDAKHAAEQAESIEEKVEKITALLRINKLDESLDKCNWIERNFETDEIFDKKIKDLCKKQLIDKIKKTPKNKITPKIAPIYYDNYEDIVGDVIQNNGGIILLDSFFQEEIGENIYMYKTIMVQTSGHIIGGLKACIAPSGGGKYFQGYAKYIGKKTYTTIFGEQKIVPNFQLLWCSRFSEDI